MNFLGRYLLNLDSRKSAHLFLGSLAIGSLSIIADFLLPASPVFVVMLYGTILVLASWKYLVVHSDVTKNSPYFLAFLLFLVSLYQVFVSAAGMLDASVILPKLGSALLPTVFGLGARQMLFAYDAAQREHDSYYRQLEEELRENAAGFRKAQHQLVDLVRDFVEERKLLLFEESKASRRYISALTKASDVFEDLSGSYPTSIQSALERISQSLIPLNDRAVSLTNTLADVKLTTITSVSVELDAIAKAAYNANQSLSALKQVADPLTSSIQEAHKQIAELGPASSAAIAQVGKALDEGVGDALAQFSSKLDAQRKGISAQAANILTDLEAIDQILGDFVELLKRQLDARAGRHDGQ